MLTQEQVEFYNEHGYVRVPQVFTPDEIEELADELDRLVQDWAITDQGWTGPWRKAYMNEETEKKSKLTAMHDLQFYSAAWLAAVTGRKLAEAMTDLLGPNVELHHSTMHIKPPESGHPFPMHQDSPFYEHENGAFVDVLVHLDDTNAANGEIRFLDGSHKLGKLQHITQTADGPCSPHLPTDRYRLEDTVPVPALRGDIVCFSIYTVHGSYLNTTDKPGAWSASATVTRRTGRCQARAATGPARSWPAIASGVTASRCSRQIEAAIPGARGAAN